MDPNVLINPRNTTAPPLFTGLQAQTFGQFKNFKLNLLETTLLLLKHFCHIWEEVVSVIWPLTDTYARRFNIVEKWWGFQAETF